MSGERDALIRGIYLLAEYDLPRMVLADWLEENDDPAWAELIRIQGCLANPSAASPFEQNALVMREWCIRR